MTLLLGCVAAGFFSVVFSFVISVSFFANVADFGCLDFNLRALAGLAAFLICLLWGSLATFFGDSDFLTGLEFGRLLLIFSDSTLVALGFAAWLRESLVCRYSSIFRSGCLGADFDADAFRSVFTGDNLPEVGLGTTFAGDDFGAGLPCGTFLSTFAAAYFGSALAGEAFLSGFALVDFFATFTGDYLPTSFAVSLVSFA